MFRCGEDGENGSYRIRQEEKTMTTTTTKKIFPYIVVWEDLDGKLQDYYCNASTKEIATDSCWDEHGDEIEEVFGTSLDVRSLDVQNRGA